MRKPQSCEINFCQENIQSESFQVGAAVAAGSGAKLQSGVDDDQLAPHL